MKAYRELKEASDKLIDGDSQLRFRKLCLRDLNDTNYDDLNEHEIACLQKRKALVEWVRNREDLLTSLVKYQIRNQMLNDPELMHMQDYETYFMEMIIAS